MRANPQAEDVEGNMTPKERKLRLGASPNIIRAVKSRTEHEISLKYFEEKLTPWKHPGVYN